ncbi:GIY-YIG nuclease family protein [Burkholderia ubonensis]|uniref:GIY-YIG nuclease family protein n=1 Tax=Burkholderia ubonensis TaxID=101571 RepID=UPI00075DAB16|nr:GIY-YIG nuclease family protein [Burkholderia ubonensis]KVD11965.1 excinuclease [Burkholderia ubonensis]KVD61583.1 excinuclease [Burkholderia ubonensis]KVN45326.1 excinuclease [Burkholderia ubonensis]OJA98789.1 excinuclease [Burkholderia ubonensis]OJB08853.1 excinuclease [Burkholderia ubonensis]
MSWFLYLIECADGSVYTGITTDVAARFDEHAAGKGARYTRSRKPRAVLASFPLADRSSALRAEYWVKRLSPKQKRELAAGMRTLESVLPVAAVADDADGDGEEKAAPARASRKRAPKGDVTAADAAFAVDTAAPNGDAPKRGRAAAKQSPTRTGPAAKAAPKARTRAAAKPRPASGPPPAPKPAPAPKKTARAKQNRAAS